MESFDEGCQDFPVLMVEELQAKLEQIRDEKWPQWNVPRVRVVLHWEHILASTSILNSLGQARPTTGMAEDLLGIGTHNEAYARVMQRLHEEV